MSPYTVLPGDTLATIVQTCGGNLSGSAILAANSISDPSLVYAGDLLVLPGCPIGAAIGQANSGKMIRCNDSNKVYHYIVMLLPCQSVC